MTTAAPTDFPTFLWLWNRGQRLPTPGHHLEIAKWLSRVWRGRHRQGLLLAFRSSGKSTIVGVFCAWVLWRRPDTRILVLAADHALARKMVRNVKRVIERHPLTPALKPRRRDQWASDQFTVERPGELRDPSMLARGIGANITGSRADIIVCDDVEVPNTCDTPGKRADLRERLSELDYVLVPNGMQIYVGTPHTTYTLYAEAPRPEAGEERAFLAGFDRMVLPLVDETGASAWPERFPPEKIASLKRRSGPRKWASQMMLQPVSLAEGRLDPDRLRQYECDLSYHEGNRQPVLRIDGVRMLSASCWWDPAFGAPGRGDASVVAAVFTDAEGLYRLHRVAYLIHEPASPVDPATQMCRQVAAFASDLHLPAVRVETNGLGRFLPALLRREMAAAQVACAVIEATTRAPKDQRIVEAFDAVLAAGALLAHRSVFATPFIAEMREWRPGGATEGKVRDDGLDAVAGCLLAEPVRIARSTAPARAPDWRPGAGPWTATEE